MAVGGGGICFSNPENQDQLGTYCMLFFLEIKLIFARMRSLRCTAALDYALTQIITAPL
jgi:uncharacterized protein YqjF (DUF2071 family)